MSTTIELTNAFLKEKMTDAMVYRGAVVDLDTCVKPGIYDVTGASTTQSTPPYTEWQMGTLEVWERSGEIFQRITFKFASRSAIRSRVNGVWTNWFRYTLTEVT